MAQLNEDTITTVNKIITKGDPIVISGATGSGKSTAIGFLAKGDIVRNLLSIREASGKGSTIETNIIVTDSEDIPENEMIVSVKMIKPEHYISNYGDDNAFLGKILHSTIKEYEKKRKTPLTESKLLKEIIKESILTEIKNPSNDSLAYKIKDFSAEELKKLVSKVSEFPFDKLTNTFNEAKAICEQKYPDKNRSKHERHTLIELISENQHYSKSIAEFWKCITEILKRQSEEVQNMLREAGALSLNGIDNSLSDEGNTFMMALGNGEDGDYNSSLTKILLKSEDSSKEFLFQEMSIIFRGNENLFNSDSNNYLVVTEQKGKKIRCIRCVDSMGLFHSVETTVENEAQKIIDLIMKNHADKLMLVINSYVTDTVKDSYEAIRDVLRKINKNVKIYIMYTHWDEYLRDVANKANVCNRRSSSKITINWEEMYKTAQEHQNQLTESFKENIKKNTRCNVQNIINNMFVFNAAFLLNEGTGAEEVLREKNINYESSWENLIACMLKSISQEGSKFKVKEGYLDECKVLSSDNFINATQLYRNLVVDCKGKKYWAASVRAATTKWRFNGDEHQSNIKENSYGYQNLRTNFVILMRNFAMNILNNTDRVKICIKSYVVNEDNFADMKSQLDEYLKNGQNFGREFAKLVGEESYKNGFEQNNLYYQYQRLTAMLQYTQDNYFTGEYVKLSGLIVECLQTSLKKCVKNFVDAKCIEVY